MRHNRHKPTATMLLIAISASAGALFRFDAPGLAAWLILLFGAALWMSLRAPGFRPALQAWRKAYQNRSGDNHTDPKAQA